MEIADTDRAAFRDQLKVRKAVIVKAIESLGEYGLAPVDAPPAAM